jgi:hypothetical protein
MLEQLHKIFEYYIAKHNKVFFLRFDLNYPQYQNYSSDTNIFKRFTSSYVKHLRRQGYDPCYFWVRENAGDCNSNPHYHFILLLNGSKTHKIYYHLQKATELWGSYFNYGDGLVNWCIKDRYGNPQENGIMIRRNDADFREQYNRCFNWASYLCKVNTKYHLSKSARVFGYTKLPRM